MNQLQKALMQIAGDSGLVYAVDDKSGALEIFTLDEYIAIDIAVRMHLIPHADPAIANAHSTRITQRVS